MLARGFEGGGLGTASYLIRRGPTYSNEPLIPAPAHLTHRCTYNPNREEPYGSPRLLLVKPDGTCHELLDGLACNR